MKIIDVEFKLLTSPYFKSGMVRSYGIVVIKTEDGLTGLGEPYAAVNMPTVCREATRLLKPLLIDQDASEMQSLMQKLHSTCEYFDHRGLIYCLLGAVEWALYDLAAQRDGKPLHRFLNEHSKSSVALYASTGPVQWSASHVLEDLVSCFERGFHTAKIRVGCNQESVEEAIVRTQKIAAEIPDGMRIGADAGQQIFHMPDCWSFEEAKTYIDGVSGCGLLFIEDPLLINDLEGWVALEKLKQIPIAGGEMFAEAGQFRRYIEAGAFDVVQPDASVLAGPRASLQVGGYAEHSHTPMVMHGWAGPVAQMQNIHAALASPSCDLVEYCTLFHPLLEETLAPLWKFENGRLQAPTLPGMGVEITAEIEKQYPFKDSVGNLIA